MTADRTASRLIGELVSRGWTLATCESITAGGIAALVTTVPGSSAAFRGGLITYASDLKVSLAGVDGQWVAEHGVINPETAIAMARGAARVCGADVVIAVTGTAGPSGEDGVPSGVVWCAVALPGEDQPLTRRFLLSGDRDAVRTATAHAAIGFALEAVQSQPAERSGHRASRE